MSVPEYGCEKGSTIYKCVCISKKTRLYVRPSMICTREYCETYSKDGSSANRIALKDLGYPGEFVEGAVYRRVFRLGLDTYKSFLNVMREYMIDDVKKYGLEIFSD